MKVLYFTKYTRQGASSRLRSYQYFPFLEENGIQVTVKPLFDDAYVAAIYSKKSKVLLAIKAYLKRFILLFCVFKYNKVVIEKELFPYFFSWFERIFSLFGVQYVVDYDDAIFHNYDLSTNPIIRFMLKNKIDHVMRYSSCVIAGNSYLAQRSVHAGAKKVLIIPTVIDYSRYEVKQHGSSSIFTIGWIGSPSTFKYVKELKEVFIKLSKNNDVRIVIVGANEDLGLPNMQFYPWSEEKEVAMISQFDVGIMPLQNTPWELGKCSYKLIQYMGCGIPVIASPVGMNVEVVQENKNGFLVNTVEEWYLAIEKIIQNTDLRLTMGENGRKLVESNYSLNNHSNKIFSLLKDE